MLSFLIFIFAVYKSKQEEMDNIAAKDGWRIVQPREALDMGFEELANWSRPETDVLVLVGDDFLVCLNKETIKA